MLFLVNISDMPHMFKILFYFTVFTVITGCATSQQNAETTANSGPDLNQLEQVYWENVRNARMKFTQADVDFMTGMIGHHAQALIMSRLAPENEASSEIQVLAARIINAQNDEIETMQRWLRLRNQPVPEIHIEGLNLMIHGLEGHGGHHHDHAQMPGMLTQQQLEQLAQTKGSEFDRLFLEFMIAHHSGAVIMVDELFATDGAAQDEEAFRLASDIQVDQITEIERMKLMLAGMEQSQ